MLQFEVQYVSFKVKGESAYTMLQPHRGEVATEKQLKILEDFIEEQRAKVGGLDLV